MNNKDLEIVFENYLVITPLLKELRQSVRRKYKALSNISKASFFFKYVSFY